MKEFEDPEIIQDYAAASGDFKPQGIDGGDGTKTLYFDPSYGLDIGQNTFAKGSKSIALGYETTVGPYLNEFSKTTQQGYQMVATCVFAVDTQEKLDSIFNLNQASQMSIKVSDLNGSLGFTGIGSRGEEAGGDKLKDSDLAAYRGSFVAGSLVHTQIAASLLKLAHEYSLKPSLERIRDDLLEKEYIFSVKGDDEKVETFCNEWRNYINWAEAL